MSQHDMFNSLARNVEENWHDFFGISAGKRSVQFVYNKISFKGNKSLFIKLMKWYLHYQIDKYLPVKSS